MANLDQRHVRLFGQPFALWDVRDVEAHVRTLLDAYLRERGAHLDATKYDDALSYLVETCWRLAGLRDDGTQRRLHYAEISIAGARSIALGPFGDEDRARAAAGDWRQANLPAGVFSFVGYRSERQAGAYDPSFGLAFSTYSRRILSRRIVDWYRDTFGDSRYGDRPKPVSLDQMADRWLEDDDQQPAGRARPGFVDDLNRHAYYDPTEEVLTRAAIAR